MGFGSVLAEEIGLLSNLRLFDTRFYIFEDLINHSPFLFYKLVETLPPVTIGPEYVHAALFGVPSGRVECSPAVGLGTGPIEGGQ